MIGVLVLRAICSIASFCFIPGGDLRSVDTHDTHADRLTLTGSMLKLSDLFSQVTGNAVNLLRVAAELTSQIGRNGVVPSRQYTSGLEIER